VAGASGASAGSADDVEAFEPFLARNGRLIAFEAEIGVCDGAVEMLADLAATVYWLIMPTTMCSEGLGLPIHFGMF